MAAHGSALAGAIVNIETGAKAIAAAAAAISDLFMVLPLSSLSRLGGTRRPFEETRDAPFEKQRLVGGPAPSLAALADLSTLRRGGNHLPAV